MEKNDIIFSELSPRPHDTGMVTLYTQNLSEFDLHARAILGFPIPNIYLMREGFSTVIKAKDVEKKTFQYKFEGIEGALKIDNVDIRIFGKLEAWSGRRLGIILSANRELGLKAKSLISIKKK